MPLAEVGEEREFGRLRVAAVHEWLVNYSGAEKVLEQIVGVLPQADLFAVIDYLPRELRHVIGNKRVQTTFIQRLPFAKRRYRSYLPLMPLAIEQLDLSGYDLVISSNHAVAKGVLIGPDQLHISYVHSPMRYAWDMQHQYLRQAGLHGGPKGWVARWLMHKLRTWDVTSANRVDLFVANSKFIARRILKVYRREAQVIYPPVDVEFFVPGPRKDDFYLAASRMVPYKRMDLIVQAFSKMPDRSLIVIGNGPDFDRIRSSAASNVTFLGYRDAEVLRDYMQRAKAFVFAAEEDFGIAPVEAQACGVPVIAFGRGGVTESVLGLEADRPTGVFFGNQTVGDLAEAVAKFEAAQSKISPSACRENALRFSAERFRAEFGDFVRTAWQDFSRVHAFSSRASRTRGTA